MKKIILILLVICSLVCLTSCSSAMKQLGNAITLKLSDTQRCKDLKIKFMDSNYSSSGSYYITPSGFNMDKLDELGYCMEIEVTYSVYYKKDYDVLWDIGYAGSPKYEVSIVNSDGLGKFEYDLTTKTTPIKRSIKITSSIADLKNQRLVLSFSTDNVQNIIYFTDIEVNYRCY